MSTVILCFDCHIYGIQYGVRCISHRTPFEEMKLQAVISDHLKRSFSTPSAPVPAPSGTGGDEA